MWNAVVLRELDWEIENSDPVSLEQPLWRAYIQHKLVDSKISDTPFVRNRDGKVHCHHRHPNRCGDDPIVCKRLVARCWSCKMKWVYKCDTPHKKTMYSQQKWCVACGKVQK